MKRTLLPAMLLMTGLIPGAYSYPILWIVLAYLIVVHRGTFPKAAFAPLVPLALVVVAGLAFIDTVAIQDTMRDLWYFSKIILIGIIGLYLGFSTEIHTRLMHRLSIVILILSVVNSWYALSSGEVDGSRYIAYIAVFMTPFFWRYKKDRNFSHGIAPIAIIIPVITMLVLSESRTGFLALGISALAAYGAFNKASKFLLIFGAMIALIIVCWPLLPQYDVANITFLGKIQNSINEVAFETGESRLDMYVNWRGFEAYRAYETWLHGSPLEQIFGLGLGAHINLGQIVAYGDGEVDTLPFVHNAYFTLLVKTGVVGVAGTVYFLLLPFRIPFDRRDSSGVVLSQLSRGSSIVLLLATALIAGPLNKQSMDGVLLMWAWSSGALMRVRRRADIQAKIDRAATIGRKPDC